MAISSNPLSSTKVFLGRVKTIADESNYESEAAFNRAFKRHFGLPPGDWRKHHARY
jgi:AraC-like DNA-binding protein